jgi:hypothetical protein
MCELPVLANRARTIAASGLGQLRAYGLLRASLQQTASSFHL